MKNKSTLNLSAHLRLFIRWSALENPYVLLRASEGRLQKSRILVGMLSDPNMDEFFLFWENHNYNQTKKQLNHFDGRK